MADRTCATCGDPTERTSNYGAWPKYCSVKCRRLRNTRVGSQRRRESATPASRIGYADCQICGELFVSRSPRPGVACYARDCRRQHRNAQVSRYLREYKERTGEPFTRRYREKRRLDCLAYNEVRKVERTCEVCHRTWRAKRLDARFCSRRCQAEARYPRRLPVLHPDPFPASRLPLRHPARRPSRPSKPTLFVAGRCARCAESFVIAHQLENRYCSDRCAKADARAARRARKRNAYVADVRRADVFARDGWRCQICKRKVRRLAVPPHPLSPVLDHITPLADGGTHEPANVQCAHYLCNSVKGHRAANDQLRLIG